ncbi:MAG TPA: BMP family ABC transporter substrate-binding protein [Gaiellaceae bacterium]|jgi:basic membrane lipoprotein Med (substrate-binding protein (PBP1-ABC) superfamily)
MRRVVPVLASVLVLSGCGGAARDTATTTATRTTAPSGLRIGVIGSLTIDVPGIVPRRETLARIADDPLVIVDSHAASPTAVADAARAHPTIHFALVGASVKGLHAPNLAGLVLKEEDAAYLAGVTAGLSAAESGAAARVAWVGPEERALAAAFGRGVHAAAPGVAVLHQWSRSVPARCKEAALTGLGRSAVVVMAHGGLCAAAAASAAHEQNVPALALGDFLFPAVAAGLVAREAVSGVFHGGDVVFGPQTGAIGVGSLDPLFSAAAVAGARAAAQDLASGGRKAG